MTLLTVSSLLLLMSLPMLCGCEGVASGDEATRTVNKASARASTDAGRFTLLTYNIAGLPQAISPSQPHINTPRISPLLNAYDVVLVQEDFVYHDALISAVEHPHRSRPRDARPNLLKFGDGLNVFSRLPFDALQRETWRRCNGTFSDCWDCRANKGFSATRVRLSEHGPKLTLINLHMDAGRSDGDYVARRAQIEQLVEWLAANTRPDEPLIIAGDTNLNTDDPLDRATFEHLLDATGLRDACVVSADGAAAPVDDCEGAERIDKVLFRSGRGLELDVHAWQEPREFVDASFRDLSDHKPVAVEFTWSRARLVER